MENYYFTFGHGHDLFPGYVRVLAKDVHTAIDRMITSYGRKWCAVYRYLNEIDPQDRTERDCLMAQEPVASVEQQLISHLGDNTECTVCFDHFPSVKREGVGNRPGVRLPEEVELDSVIVDGDDILGELCSETRVRLEKQCLAAMQQERESPECLE